MDEQQEQHVQKEEHVQQEQQEQKKKGKGGVLVIIVIIVLLGIIIFLLLRDKDDEKEERNVLVTPENVESVLKAADEDEMTGYYTVTMNPVWHFATGNEASYDAIVANDAGNTNDVYFDVVLTEDESKVLFSSPIIPRGGQLETVELDETLEAGNYDCVVIYHLVDEEQNTLSTLRVTLEIVVEG